MKLRDLFSVRFTQQGQLTIEIGIITIIIAVVATAIICILRKHASGKRNQWEPIEAEIQLGGVGKVTIRPNHEVIRIAHQAWTELTTRKAGLPFDEENDVIANVYSSWYELFQEFRDLTRSVPASFLRQSQDANELIRVLVQVLNDGLRPHLTKWQARFARWYEQQLSDNQNRDRSPQEIQRRFPEYDNLLREMREVNQQMVSFADDLHRIAHPHEGGNC